MGEQARAFLAVLDTECANADPLAEAVAEAFRQHPDHQVITNLPGLSDQLGAWVLAEIGDDRQRFADARALKAYAGRPPRQRRARLGVGSLDQP
ncbi:transposase [Actinomadura sp. NPDC048955]|uniref:transposase n=1 Tax=Actinomadura sp. NPDC048955 TaxID=3158228 RepID=UPI0033F48AF2